MPKHLHHGDEVEATLVVITPDRTEYLEQILLLADRCWLNRSLGRERVAYTKVRPEARSTPWSANRNTRIPALPRM